MLITLTGMWVVNIRVKYFNETESPGQGTNMCQGKEGWEGA